MVVFGKCLLVVGTQTAGTEQGQRLFVRAQHNDSRPVFSTVGRYFRRPAGYGDFYLNMYLWYGVAI
jgi:hypothetical protein